MVCRSLGDSGDRPIAARSCLPSICGRYATSNAGRHRAIYVNASILTTRRHRVRSKSICLSPPIPKIPNWSGCRFRMPNESLIPSPDYRIHVLDDGKRAEMRRVAEQGVNYLSRENNIGFKAGNLRNGLEHGRGLHRHLRCRYPCLPVHLDRHAGLFSRSFGRGCKRHNGFTICPQESVCRTG